MVSGDPLKIISGTDLNTEFNNIQTAIATKADLASPALSGTPTAPTQAAGNNTTRIATTAFVQTASQSAVPVGGIIMWGGLLANIPPNYQICDGTNGTPDLRNKFILGANTETGGILTSNLTGSATSSGGSKDAVVVSHTHTGTTVVNGGHVHGISAYGGFRDATPNFITGRDNAAFGPNTLNTQTSGEHSHTFTTDSSGVTGTNANLPPYYVLAFIRRMS